MSFNVLLLLWCIVITKCEVQISYISKNGSDHSNCGISQNNACGTLFYLTSKIYNTSTYAQHNITIMDGQNEKQITEYVININNNVYHPCFPIPFTNPYSWISISYYFNPRYITKMNDWYPNICNDVNYDLINNTGYIVMMMFHFIT